MTLPPPNDQEERSDDPQRPDHAVRQSDYETISTREGKEQLREAALEVVAKIIDEEGGEGEKVEQLYFTSFVMQ